MLFNFNLKPLDEVDPFGREGEYSLSWFGLTDGYYSINCAGQELFRYSDPILDIWKRDGHQLPGHPYADYQVSRLWEDVLEILPEILSPVPQQLLQRIKPGVDSALWHHRISEFVFRDDGEASELDEKNYDLATNWLGERKLNTLHLGGGPRIWLWCEGDNISIHWNNSKLVSDGQQIWTAEMGTYSLPKADFIEEVRSFDQRLIAAMQTRVLAIQKAWARPEIRIDKMALLDEQEQRSHFLSEALDRWHNAEAPKWDDIANAIDYFERLNFPIPQQL
jgi:hypothetical protein